MYTSRLHSLLTCYRNSMATDIQFHYSMYNCLSSWIEWHVLSYSTVLRLMSVKSWWANSAQVWTGSTNKYGVFQAWACVCVCLILLVNREWLYLFSLCRSGHWMVGSWAHLQVLASPRLHGELPLTLPVRLVASFITCALEHQNSAHSNTVISQYIYHPLTCTINVASFLQLSYHKVSSALYPLPYTCFYVSIATHCIHCTLYHRCTMAPWTLPTLTQRHPFTLCQDQPWVDRRVQLQ